MNKFQPFKSCSCSWCKGSRQHVSRSGSKAYSNAKKRAHRKFRRTGKNIGLDYEMPGYLSCDRWY